MIANPSPEWSYEIVRVGRGWRWGVTPPLSTDTVDWRGVERDEMRAIIKAKIAVRSLNERLV